MDKSINIGVIGTGRFGIQHLYSFKQMENSSNVKLSSMADINPEKCKEYGKKFGIKAYGDFKQMIEQENLHAVSIATPDHLHGDIALFALNHGLHVFVEKPMAVDSSISLEMVNLAKMNDLLLQVDFHKRYDPYHLEIKQLTDSDKFGKLLYGYCHMENQITVPSKWFPHWASESSPAWFLGSNFIDLMGWLIQVKALTVFAKGQKEKLVSMGIDTFDSIQAVVTYENNAVITYHMAWILPEQFPSIVNQGFRLVGSEGIVEADTQDRGTQSCFTSEPVMKTHNSGFIYTSSKPDGTNYFTGYGIESIQHFAKNVQFLKKGGELDYINGRYPSGEEAHEVTKIIEAIHESIETGDIIDIQSERINKIRRVEFAEIHN